MTLLREYIREQLLLEKEQQETSLLSGVSDFIESQHYDDVIDSVFKRIAPNMVRHVLEREINEDMSEFLDGAIEGRWEKERDWAGEDPSPEEHGHSRDSADYTLGYTWGWNNANSWEGNTLPSEARKEAVEVQIREFEDQISEQMVIAALEAANEKVNPIKLLGKAKDAIVSAVKAEGMMGGLKKGLPIAIGIIVGEALDNFIIPMAFYSLTGIPIPPLPVGVGEIINPVVINMVGADVETEELADELGWYEEEYGEASSLGPRPSNEIRNYIREMLNESYFPIYAQDKMRIHHSREGTRSGVEPQISGFSQKIGAKPAGLWYECQDGSSETWEEFCTVGMTGGYDKYDSTYNVVLKDDGYHILHIPDVAHFEKFHKMYSVNHPADPDGSKGLDKMIDWPKVAEHYAGIEICPYLSSKRDDDDAFWYYGWDVASGCVWDSRGIEELVKAGDCDEPAA